jgi:hypothetical protein
LNSIIRRTIKHLVDLFLFFDTHQLDISRPKSPYHTDNKSYP